jgi:hypothetical protein
VTDKKLKFQGEFGHVFIDTIQDYYRPHRRPPLKLVSSTIGKFNRTQIEYSIVECLGTNSLSALERRYRLCSTLLDHPPSLPSPPLAIDSNDRLNDLLMKDSNDMRDDESIISTSTLADDDNLINDIETENIQLLKTLASNRDVRSLSPVLVSHELSTMKNSESLPNMSTTSSTATMDIKSELNETIPSLTNNESDKKDRPLVEGTDKVIENETT